MRIKFTGFKKYKVFVTAVCLFIMAQLGFSLSAYSQIDYYYGRNLKGFRIGFGPGFSSLKGHYDTNPSQNVFVADIDYAFTPYFSLGLNSQFGTLMGQDASNINFYYHTSTDSYKAFNLNVKMGIGKFNDFASNNAFMDAVKRIYFGLGVGQVMTDIKYSINSNISQSTVYNDPNNPWVNGAPPSKALNGSYITYSLDLGTYIDLPGFLGVDKVELCPNLKTTYADTYYLEGFKTSAKSSLKGIYTLTSLTLRYKF